MATITDGYIRIEYDGGALLLSINELAKLPKRAELLATDSIILQAGQGKTTFIAGGYDASGSGGNVHLVPGEGNGTSHGEVRVYYHNAGEQNLSIAMTVINEGVKINSKVGFNGTTPISKPTVTGSKSGNTALASLISALASYGLITDSTS